MTPGRLAAGYVLGAIATLELVAVFRAVRKAQRLIRAHRQAWRQAERILGGWLR